MAFLLGGHCRGLIELVDGFGVSRLHGQHVREAGADHDVDRGFGSSGEHAAGQLLGVSQPAGRQQGNDQIGGQRVALWIAGFGDLEGPLQHANRRSRRPRCRGVRRPLQPSDRVGVASLGPERDVTRHPLDGRAGAA